MPDQWAHVAFSIDGTGHATLMVDGDAIASGVFGGNQSGIRGWITRTACVKRACLSTSKIAEMTRAARRGMFCVRTRVKSRACGKRRKRRQSVKPSSFRFRAVSCWALPLPSALGRCRSRDPTVPAIVTPPEFTRLSPGPRMVIEDSDLVSGVSLESDEGCLVGSVYDIRIWSIARSPSDVATGRKVRKARTPRDRSCSWRCGRAVQLSDLV